MALQHLRSSTAHKRPIPTVMSAGQIAINTNEASPALFFKDSNGDLVKVGPVHIGTDAPNSSPASVAATALVTGTVYQILTVGDSDFTLVGASANTIGTIFTATGTTTGTGTVSGQQGVEKGEMWLDTTGGTYVLKIYDGTDWRSESGTFVDVSGDTMTGDLVMNNANIVFEGATADDFETTLTVTDPTADRTITLPNVTGTVVTTGDTGSVTSTMILDGTIVNADVNASAAIAGTKIDPDFGSQTIETTGVFSAAGGAAATPSITFTGDLDTGIYSPGANQVALATNGTGRLFVDSSGNVGIGTTSPAITGPTIENASVSQGLELEASSGFAAGSTVRGYYRSGSAYKPLGLTGSSVIFGIQDVEKARIDSSGKLLVGTSSVTGTASTATSILRGPASQGAYVYLCRNSAPAADNVLGSVTFADDQQYSAAFIAGFRDSSGTWTPGSSHPSRLVLSTTADGASSPTERMRIANAGTCAHFATNNTVLGANSSAASGNTVRLFSGSYSATAVFSGTESFRIWSSGDVNNQNNSYTGISDIKLKENIEDAPSQWLDIKALRVRKYNLKQGSKHKQIGLIAQELEKSSPGLVEDLPDLEGGSTTKSVKYSVLYMKAVKALQEAMERIETLEAKVAALEAG